MLGGTKDNLVGLVSEASLNLPTPRCSYQNCGKMIHNMTSYPQEKTTHNVNIGDNI